MLDLSKKAFSHADLPCFACFTLRYEVLYVLLYKQKLFSLISVDEACLRDDEWIMEGR